MKPNCDFLRSCLELMSKYWNVFMMISQSINKIGFLDRIISEWIVISVDLYAGVCNKRRKISKTKIRQLFHMVTRKKFQCNQILWNISKLWKMRLFTIFKIFTIHWINFLICFFFCFYLRKTILCIWVKISSCMYFRSNFFFVLNWSKSITIVSIFMNE